MSHVVGAFAFRREAYSEVKDNVGFTSTAWLLVVVANFLGQLGVHAVPFDNPIQWTRGVIIGTVFAVAAFFIVVAILEGIGRQAFHAEVTRGELVRTLGLASVWSTVGLLGILAAISPALNWVVGAAQLAAFAMGFAASLFAAKKALDLDWIPVVVAVVIAWVVAGIVLALAAVFLALFGFGGSGILGGILG
jgi:hypothetical protein